MSQTLTDLITQTNKLLERYDYAFNFLEKKAGDYDQLLKIETDKALKLLRAEIVDLDVEATILKLRNEAEVIQKDIRKEVEAFDINVLAKELNEKLAKASLSLEEQLKTLDVEGVLAQIKKDTDEAIAKIKASVLKAQMVAFQHTLPSQLKSNTKYEFMIVGGTPNATYKIDTQSIFAISKAKNIKADETIFITTPLVEDKMTTYEIAIIEVVGDVETTKIVDLEVGHIEKAGQLLFDKVGTHSFIVPDNVSSICAVAVGGGGGGNYNWAGNAGNGGALAYANNISVTAGEIITVVVGAGGTGYTTVGEGGDSLLKRANNQVLFTAQGGKNSDTPAKPLSGSTVCYGGQGGIGGNNGSKQYGGGGGAGGYGVTIDGSDAKGGNGSYGTKATAGQKGGGGGGGGYDSSTYAFGGGGGVGLNGIGTSGDGGALNNGNSFYSDGRYGGKGGSNGDNGADNTNGSQSINGRTYYHGCGGRFGGGGAGGGTSVTANSNFCYGGQGGVRIIWGEGRSFPNFAVDVIGEK